MPTDHSHNASELFRPLPAADAAAWRERVVRDLEGRTPEDLVTTLHEGIRVAALYTAEDAPAETGYPGLPPFRRGAAPLPRERWVICQEHDAPSPEKAHSEIAADLARGVDGLWLTFAPFVRGAGRTGAPDTRTAYSREDPDADADGIALARALDLDTLLASVPLPTTYLAFRAGAGTPALAALLATHVRARGADLSEIQGCLGYDPLGALVTDGRLPSSLEDALATMRDLATWSLRSAPGLRAVLVDTRPYHDAGATAVDELAYALATGTTYLRRLTTSATDEPDPRGEAERLGVVEAARAMSFAFSIGRDFFVEVAKLRAARLLWSKVLAASGAGEAVPPMHVHARTSFRTKTRRDPWVNVLRATTETLVGVLGAAEVITTSTFDEALGRPDALARRLASNTAHILARESHIARIADPLGGSWYVEHLTDALARAAWARFQAIEALGGMALAVTRGEIQKQTNVAAEKKARAIAERRDPIVGVSIYAKADETVPAREARGTSPALEPPTSTAEDDDAAARELERTRAARKGPPGSLVPCAIDALRAGTPFPSLLAALSPGSDPAFAPRLRRRRDAASFERLRDRTDAAARGGRRPSVFLANLGDRRTHGARAVFARRFLEAGGLAVIDTDGFANTADAARAFSSSGARAAVICSSDEMYGEHAADTARALTTAGARVILLAGREDESGSAWRAEGIADFIHLGSDAVATLESLLNDIEGAP